MMIHVCYGKERDERNIKTLNAGNPQQEPQSDFRGVYLS